ncbi:ankyrin repeat domain-containing protein [Endozoicomonas sp. GU-1]|uniref:ankyrin repeat domain-containing protein n=1 Tax=Endozoicomonas sp. GU-1 TaxID=3009078 RepID=UPI0022B46DCB|nr:ankyrin repeat domain-containing protein [Endozoicomonas sp. GU-1]WBA80866.1 ankyrin repeat domain-containing protein [Endozoicomonas sp. GU-1]WBA88430.1 ankyrin repeat domain-containing protein [Endozoicomonas sp. GU-1]
MSPDIRQCLLPWDDTDNPEEGTGSSNAQPSPAIQQPVASAENSSDRGVASPGNGSLRLLTSDVDLRGLGDQLAAAIRKQDLAAVNDLLNLVQDLGIDPNLCDRQGYYPLYWASRWGSADRILKTLLDRGANPNLCNIDPWSGKKNIPLLCAAESGSYEVSKVLLEYGADPQARDGSDWTALHRATWKFGKQSIMLMKCLLDHGADINARNRMGRTPLFNAVIRDALPAVNILLSEGADPNIPDNYDRTALDSAVLGMSTNMVDDLLAHGANPDTPGGSDSDGRSNALCMALRKQYRDDIVDMLFAYGANPNRASKEGDTPLHVAIEKSNATGVDKLLAHGANPNIRNQSGQTALEAALVTESPPRIIDALREPFKPVSLQFCARRCIRATLMRTRMTPKKRRIKPLSKESQHLLLADPLTKSVSNPLTLAEMDSSIRQCSPDAANPEQTAVDRHFASAKNISAHGVASPGNGSMHLSTSDLDLVDQLVAATSNGDRKTVDNLLDLLEERGIDPNLCDRQGHHPLYGISDRFNRVANVIKTLLTRGVDPNFATFDPLTNRAYIPLLLAAENGSYLISKALLDHGADLQAHDCGWTVLHFAARRFSEQKVMLLKCLLDNGADINARNHDGHTPLCIAALGKELLNVNILLGEGADPNIPDKDGKTALDYAVFNRCGNMVDDLLAHGANPDIRNPSGQTALEAALATGAPVHIIDALRGPFTPGATKVCARNCMPATRVQPQLTLKKTRAKPLSLVTQRLPLPNTLKKFVSNPLTF